MHTVDRKEIENFAKDSDRWWDENGPFRPLHRLNPVRLAYFKERITAHYGLDNKNLHAYEGLSILDIGCGGGLVCEPMARLGGTVTGIDADENAIRVAGGHAIKAGLDIEYRALSSGDLVAQRQHYDVVLALEIVEHVADVDAFIADCAALCKPGGIIILSTLNRTAKSFLLGKVAAEYILGWVPKGTHDWKKFLKPSELAGALRRHGMNVTDLHGMMFDPLTRDFRLHKRDIDVNYFITAEKP